MDIAFFAVAEAVIDRIEDRYGKLAGVAVAVVMIALPIASIVLAVAWFTF